jgi:hypothetical protein
MFDQPVPFVCLNINIINWSRNITIAPAALRRWAGRGGRRLKKKGKKAYLWVPYLDAILQFDFTDTDLHEWSFSL